MERQMETGECVGLDQPYCSPLVVCFRSAHPSLSISSGVGMSLDDPLLALWSASTTSASAVSGNLLGGDDCWECAARADAAALSSLSVARSENICMNTSYKIFAILATIEHHLPTHRGGLWTVLDELTMDGPTASLHGPRLLTCFGLDLSEFGSRYIRHTQLLGSCTLRGNASSCISLWCGFRRWFLARLMTGSPMKDRTDG